MNSSALKFMANYMAIICLKILHANCHELSIYFSKSIV